MRHLVRSIQRRGALAVVVNVVSGDARFARDAKYSKCGLLKTAAEEEAMIGCVDKKWLYGIREAIVAMAGEESAPVLEVECQTNPELCGSDSFHLNQDGHKLLAGQILALMNASRATVSPREDDAPPPNMVCARSEELVRYMGSRSRGFFFENAATQGAPKPQLSAVVSSDTNATLSLCLPTSLEESERATRLRAGK